MDPAEYLAFIPLLIYGLALADLLGQWRRFFQRKYFYLPYFLTTLVLTEIAVWNVFIYLEVTSQLESVVYFRYWIYLLQPMIFLIAVSALTPEQEVKETESYFKQRMPIVFGLMAVYVASHLFDYIEASGVNKVRLATVVMLTLIAVTRKVWLLYVMVILWFISLANRITFPVPLSP